MSGKWQFVIDTNQYAGNFEREMCAYITGCIGDCEVGEEFAELARKELSEDQLEAFDSAIINVPDEHGCARPVEIVPNPNWWNDGNGNHWRKEDKDFEKHKAAYIKTEIETNEGYMSTPKLAIRSLKAGKPYSNWTIPAAKKEIKRLEEDIEQAKKIKKLKHYEAYNSVGIWFAEEPPKAMISLMKERAAKFAVAKREYDYQWEKKFKLTIEGFRLIRHRKSEEIMAI